MVRKRPDKDAGAGVCVMLDGGRGKQFKEPLLTEMHNIAVQ